MDDLAESDSDIEKGSQMEGMEFCHPCTSEGKYAPAEGYCQTCRDYLCTTCLTVHRIPRPLRNHVILNKERMPREGVITTSVTNSCIAFCTEHLDEKIKFFCPAHKVVICGVCASIKHKVCATEFIPDVAGGYKDSTEYKTLVDDLRELDTAVGALSSDIKYNIENIPKAAEKALEEIRQARKNVNDCLERNEKELEEKTNQIREEDTEKLQNLIADVECFKLDTEKLRKQLHSVESETSDLFVISKQLEIHKKSLVERFLELAEKNKVIDYVVKCGETLTTFLSSDASGLWTLEKKITAQQFKYISLQEERKETSLDLKSTQVTKMADVNVKTEEDTYSIFVTGMVYIKPQSLLLVDYYNCCVKSVDTSTSTITSRLTVSSWPWDITKMPDDRVAVTLPNERKIQIVSTARGLSVVGSFRVRGECMGVSSTVDRLVVTYRNLKMLEVIGFDGTTFLTVGPGIKGKSLFITPRYVAVAVDEKIPFIYVSDHGNNSVSKLSIEGRILSPLRHKSWGGLTGITVAGKGQLFVCNYGNHTVDVVSEDGTNIHTLLSSKEGIKLPQSVCFCPHQKVLFVSCVDVSESVQVYKLKQIKLDEIDES